MDIKFWKKVSKIDNGCWVWLGSKDKNGYGVVRRNNKTYFAHRYSFYLENNYFPSKLYVLHKCDNTACVNPNHLFLGTQKDNMDDMKSKGRDNRYSGNRKLSLNEVKEIRSKLANGKRNKDVAIEYKISVHHVSKIKNNIYWK